MIIKILLKIEKRLPENYKNDCRNNEKLARRKENDKVFNNRNGEESTKLY